MENINTAELVDLWIFDGKEAVIQYLKDKNIDDNEIETILKILKEYIDN